MSRTLKLLVLAALTLTVQLYANCAFAQSIESKFKEEAPRKWLALRKLAFDDTAIAVETFWKDSRAPNGTKDGKPREIKTRYKQFADGNFKYYESTPLSDTNPAGKVPFNRRHVTVHNAENTFLIHKDPDSKWKIRSVEKSPDKYEFDEESVAVNWLSKNRNKKGPLTSLTHSFSQDPRLITARTGTIESFVSGYLGYDESSFTDFKIREDPVFGRIVTASISVDLDVKDRPRRRARPTNTVKLEVRGKIKFLADWHWVPISKETTHREFDKNGKEVKVAKSTLKVVYDPKQLDPRKIETAGKPKQLFPTLVETKYESTPDKRSYETSYNIRPLSKSEIATIKKSKKLSDFGLDKKPEKLK